MKKEELLSKLAFVLDISEESVVPQTVLAELPGWNDSLGQLSVITMFNKAGVKIISIESFRQCKTVADLLELAKDILE